MGDTPAKSPPRQEERFTLAQWRNWPASERWELIEGTEDQADTVVQPDVFVVCDPDKLIDEGVRGAPDFVVEVLSDSTALKDLDIKKTPLSALWCSGILGG